MTDLKKVFWVIPGADEAYWVPYRNNSGLSCSENLEISGGIYYYLGYIPLDGNRRYFAVYRIVYWPVLKLSGTVDAHIDAGLLVCKEVDAKKMGEILANLVREQPGVYVNPPMSYQERQAFNRELMGNQIAFSTKNRAVQNALELGMLPSFNIAGNE